MADSTGQPPTLHPSTEVPGHVGLYTSDAALHGQGGYGAELQLKAGRRLPQLACRHHLPVPVVQEKHRRLLSPHTLRKSPGKRMGQWLNMLVRTAPSVFVLIDK